MSSIADSRWHLGDSIHGNTYGYWTGEFWKWLTREPLDSGPGRAGTCDTEQSGNAAKDYPVFFLAGFLAQDCEAGNSAENVRKCISIKPGKSILIGVINKLATRQEDQDLSDQDLCRDRANMAINRVSAAVARIDDEVFEMKELDRVYYSWQLDLGDDDNNFFGNTMVNTPAASDGYWLFLKSSVLDPNKDHTVHIEGQGNDCDPAQSPFATNVTYNPLRIQ